MTPFYSITAPASVNSVACGDVKQNYGSQTNENTPTQYLNPYRTNVENRVSS